MRVGTAPGTKCFQATDRPWAPWYIARPDNKKRARLNIITQLLSQIPYEEILRVKIELPKRKKRRGLRRA